MIEIDGSRGEGGGSILRQAIALSLLTKKPFRIKNIRSNRPNPGLAFQHLSSIELARKVSSSKIIGAQIGSTELEFYPGELRGCDVKIDIGSAGSVVLAMQSVIIPAIFSGHKYKIDLIGGTDVSWSPTVDYFKEVFVSSLEMYGKIEVSSNRRGYYPKGGGDISVSIIGNKEKGELIRESLGPLLSLKGIISSSKNFFHNSSPSKAVEIANISTRIGGTKSNISSFSSDANSNGASFTFYAVFANTLSNERFFRVGVCDISDNESILIDKIENKASELRELISSKVPVDEHLCDQLIVLLGYVGGRIVTNIITPHTLSNIEIAELFLGRKFIIRKLDELYEISCE